jgi:uncharacterized membrane protein YbaN (DUF454 family)
MQLVWKALALLFVLLAAAAAAMPVLPMVPFVLLAAAAAARGWPRLLDRLVRDPRYGAVVVNWRERGALPRGVKLAGVAGMALAIAGVVVLPLPGWLAAGLAAAAGAYAWWIWTRPEG